MANEYWRTREEQALAEYQLTDDEYVKQLNDIYDYMVDQINREIRGFYSKYADAEGITMAEAAKRASELDMDEYSRKAKKYVAEKDFSAQANREMRLYNMTMKVNRLELLKSNIGLEMVDGFQDIEDLFGDSLTERAMDEFRRQAGILGNTVHDVARDADSIVGASFHNANWSDRIWMYQGMLRDELSTLLQQGMIQGRNPNELARHINNLFDAGKYNCERLMRTEMTRVQSDAQLQSFIANGFDEYQFNALGDACPDCKALDEQHFKITDAEPGENLPPIHPNCRCAVSAWMDDANYDEWLDSYADHGMSYEDWLEHRPTVVDGAVPYNSATVSEQYRYADAVNEYKYYEDEQYRINAIRSETGFDDDKVQEVLEALCGTRQEWSPSESVATRSMNCWFNGGDTNIRNLVDADSVAKANVINDYITAAPKYKGTIYRGMSLTSDEIDSIVADGQFIENGSLSSWTSTQDAAEMFARGRTEQYGGGRTAVVLQSENPAMGVPVGHLSIFGAEENEVLVSNMADGSHNVINVEVKDGVTYITLE